MASTEQVSYAGRPSSSDVRYTESITLALNIDRPRPPEVEVTDLDKEGNIVMRRYLQTALTSWYRSWTQLLSTAGWAEPNLGMKPSRSEWKGTVYVQTMPKRRKSRRSPLEIEGGGAAHEMTEEDMVGENGTTASLTKSEKVRTAMSKLVKSIAPLWSADDVYFRNVKKKHELDTGQGLSET